MNEDQEIYDADARKDGEESGEEYDENADEDFSPDKADADNGESSSEDEDEGTEVATTSGKRKTGKRKSEAAVDNDLDSGDEATIKERKAKRRKKDTAAAEDDSGGEGGFIRTRAQRIAEKEERRNRKKGVREGAVTIDVDKMWADLSSIPLGRTVVAPPKTDNEEMDMGNDKENLQNPDTKRMVKIKREVKYAGQVRWIEEEVPRSSKEAKAYFAARPEADPDRKADANGEASALNRPLHRPSMFEPNPMGMVKGVLPEKLRLRAPSRLDFQMAQKRAEAKKAAQKMSTVQMSQHDWKMFRKDEGIEEELASYEKSGNRFLDREGFMDRVAGARQQAARDARSRL